MFPLQSPPPQTPLPLFRRPFTAPLASRVLDLSSLLPFPIFSLTRVGTRRPNVTLGKFLEEIPGGCGFSDTVNNTYLQTRKGCASTYLLLYYYYPLF